MSDTLRPRDAKDVEAAVQSALAEGKTMEIVGHGSKRAIGRPAQSDLTLDLSTLSGVTLYEPQELGLSAKAGTPLAEIEALLAAKDQQLAFEPMNCAAIFGGAAGPGTIGGALAANVSGPRRIQSSSRLTKAWSAATLARIRSSIVARSSGVSGLGRSKS